MQRAIPSAPAAVPSVSTALKDAGTELIPPPPPPPLDVHEIPPPPLDANEIPPPPPLGAVGIHPPPPPLPPAERAAVKPSPAPAEFIQAPPAAAFPQSKSGFIPPPPPPSSPPPRSNTARSFVDAMRGKTAVVERNTVAPGQGGGKTPGGAKQKA